MANPSSKHKSETRRHWRRRYVEEMAKRGEPLPADFRESEPDDGALAPPDARRVARRAAVLGTVALRGLAASWSHADQVEFVPALQAWFAASGLADEIEDAEREILNAPASELDDRSAINACWRWEGAAVLAASLGRIALPPHDAVVDTKACGDACDVFTEPKKLAKRIADARFDPKFDREAYANRTLAIHWRLRQALHSGIEPLDFAAFAKGVEWATFDLRGVGLAKGDLAIHGQPIAETPADEIGGAMSIASERHTAANWLIGWDPTYGEVENPT